MAENEMRKLGILSENDAAPAELDLAKFLELNKGSGVIGWLRNSVNHRLREARANAAQCRKAYLREPYHTAAELLARCHDATAKAFEDLLKELP